MSRPASRSSTPSQLLHPQPSSAAKLSSGQNSARNSRPGTPSRRVVQNPADQYMTKSGMPNNLGLQDPREQDRASDLLGNPNTVPVRDPPTEEELNRVRELADKFAKQQSKK